MAAHEFATLNRESILRRLQHDDSCGAQPMSIASLERKLLSLLQLALQNVLKDLWHQLRKRKLRNAK